MRNKQVNKNVYILNLEASEIYSHMTRDTIIKENFSGMIPYSLELIKLRKEGLKVSKVKQTEKLTTKDIINVKFKQKLIDGEELIKRKNKSLDKMNKLLRDLKNSKYKNKDANKIQEKIDKLEKSIEDVNSSIKYISKHIEDEKYNEVKNSKLREILYTKGFTITNINNKTGEITEDIYVAYKRSSSKSRTGQCLFIKEHLYKNMLNWGRMYLPLTEDMKLKDYAGLLAYESLVSSSLEDTIKIDVNNILIIDDLESKFMQECNIVKKDDTTQLLGSFREMANITNSLFDGESLLDIQYFQDGKAMKLLRQHMFKSASFATDIQFFLKDRAEEFGIDYDTWELKNMFGETILAKDVHMICTPTSLKALKFSNIVGEDKDMWSYWKEIVKRDDCLFGICKHEKSSKRGFDDEGNILQQTSYQMINCLPLQQTDIDELANIEKEYIQKLKNDDNFFLEYALNDANEVNTNEMMVAIARKNKDFMGTKIFRDFRAHEISSYVKHCKKGKIRLNGDYCVLLGNPVTYLYHAIGKVDVNNPVSYDLKENEIYTTMFEFDKEYVCFRNPNTSPSNVLIGKNTCVDNIKKYFKLTDNIVCVNAINFAIQDILSSADYDSDSMVIFNNPKMLEVAKKCFGKYRVCINKVESEKKEYELNKKSMYEIDNQLSTSQRNIGDVVNIGQLCMSTYWDLIASGKSEEELEDLLKCIDIATVLSCIAIDLAKKFYDINIENEIDNISKNKWLRHREMKPNFWKYVSQSKTIKNRVEHYNCPMDFLYKDLCKIKDADDKMDIKFETLLVKFTLNDANRKQITKIIDYIEELNSKINYINATHKEETKESIQEKNIMLDNVINYYKWYMNKLEVKPETMYSILEKLFKDNSKMASRLLNVLYNTQRKVFVNAFKEK